MADTMTSVPSGSSAEAGGKGLKGDALGLGSSIVIAVASTAPGIPYNPEALLAEAREEPAVPLAAEEEEEAVFLEDLGDASLNPQPTEPVDPDETPRA